MELDDEMNSFRGQIGKILEIPGVNKRKVAEWAGVDPSSVTRWTQGATPTNPIGVLKKLMLRAEQAREAAHSFTAKTSVSTWKSATGGMDPASVEYVKRTGLLANAYYAVVTWIPSSKRNNMYDIVAHRYYSEVWADMSRRTYNIGDISQTALLGSRESPRFDQAREIGTAVHINILEQKREHVRDPSGDVTAIREIDSEVPDVRPRESMARLHVQLQLGEFPFPNEAIGFIDDFGYRFRATRTIVACQADPRQTNEYLGAPIVVPCRRLKLFVCIPSNCFRGSPSALSSSNRSMFPLLMELDNIPPEQVESLLWPLGRSYDWSSSPDAELKDVPRAASMLEELPHGLREALGAPADLDEDNGESVRDIMCRQDSKCFLLDIRDPHPSLTFSIVWRLRNLAVNGQTRSGF